MGMPTLTLTLILLAKDGVPDIGPELLYDIEETI